MIEIELLVTRGLAHDGNAIVIKWFKPPDRDESALWACASRLHRVLNENKQEKAHVDTLDEVDQLHEKSKEV